MEILILGGTQFVGKHLTIEALNRNHNVTLFNRGISNSKLFSNVNHIIGNRNNKNDLKNLVKREWDVVIDVPYFPVDIVKKSIDILFDNVKRYVFISTVSIYDVNITYDNWYTKYSKDKLESEKLFYGRELKSLIFRPGILCGSGDNTNRFDYTEDGIFWKNTNKKVKNYHKVSEFSSYVLNLIEKKVRGIYEII